MKKVLLLIDQFGETPQFLINNRSHFSSLFGSIMTIFLFMITLIALFFFSEEIILRHSPSVNLSTQTEEHPRKIKYFNNFEFMIGIQNKEYKVEMNEKIFKAKGYLFNTTVNSTGTYNSKYEIDLAPCHIALQNSPNFELLSHYDLHGFYCFSKNQSSIDIDHIFINEFWGNNNFHMLQVKFSDCRNSSSDSSCAPQTEIDEALRLTELTFYTVDTFIKTRDYMHPFERGIQEKFFYVSNQFQVSITEYIRHLDVISDDGLLFTTNKQLNSFKIDSIIDYMINKRESSTFASMSIQLNNIDEVYYRKYYKIQDLAAQVGGIFKTLLIIFILITKSYSTHFYFEHLINKFFEIDLRDNFKEHKILHQLQNESSKSKDKSIRPLCNNSTDAEHNHNSMLAQVDITKKILLKKKRKNKKQLRLSFFDKLCMLSLCPKLSTSRQTNKDKLYFLGRDKLDYYMEIDNVLKHFHNQETLNSILFTNEQKALCDYIFKPILKCEAIGTRYSISTMPMIIKQKILGNDKWFSTKIIEKIKFSSCVSEEIPKITEKKEREIINEFYKDKIDEK